MSGKAASIAKMEDAGSRRRERMRHILVEAATRLFSKQGVDATTIDEIVGLAGVAKGTFYNYFTDRLDIAHSVAASMRHEMNAAVEEINQGITDPAERISRGLRLFLALVAYNPVKARMLARIYEGGADIASHGNEHLVGDLTDGIEQGPIRVPSLDVGLHLVMSLATVGMRHLLDIGAGEEIMRGEGYARDLAAILLQGLGVRPTEIERILKRPFDVNPREIWK
jgi:AcrR family transcriptional regulator